MKKKKKKTTKVKKNSVQCRKKKKKSKKKTVKKSTKKKVVKKKVVKKKVVKKKVVRKKKRRKKRVTREKLLMVDIYPILNRVQLKRKTETFVAKAEEADIIENTIKDLDLRYSRREMKRQVEFTVKPNKNNVFDDEDLLDIEYLDDEIPEPGQIFP